MRSNVVSIKNEDTVIQGSRIVFSEGQRPMRIVLRDLGDQFVTHVEFMHIKTEQHVPASLGEVKDEIVCTHESFDLGHYFDYDEKSRQTQLKRAEHDFRERCQKL